MIQKKQLALYVSDFCPFCHSCRLVIDAKGLECEIISLDLAKKANFLEVLSPYGRVPVLEHGRGRIYESLIINEYLDERFLGVNLLPQTPSEKAQVRFWCDFVLSRFVPAYFALMNAEDRSAWPSLRANFDRWIRFAEEHAFEQGFFGSKTASLADYALYPWFERFVSVERYRSVHLDDSYRRLRGWLHRMEESEPVIACAKPRSDYVDFFDTFYLPIEDEV